MPNINQLFDLMSRQKRKAKANINRRLAQIKADREAAERAVPGIPIRSTRSDRRALRMRQEQEVREQAQRVASTPLGRFLFMGEVCEGFTSSCVQSFWYYIDTQTLHIEFKDNAVYGYGIRAPKCTPEMAASMFRAKSKGSWIWDNLRIRGTRLGHQLPYKQEITPRDHVFQQSPEAEDAHWRQMQEESSKEYVRKKSVDEWKEEAGHLHIEAIFRSLRPEQNVGRGVPDMRAPRSKKATDDMVDSTDQLTGLPRRKVRLPEPD